MCRPLSFAQVPLYEASYLDLQLVAMSVLNPHYFVALVDFALSTAGFVGGVVVLQWSRECSERVELQCAEGPVNESDNSLDFDTFVVETVIAVLFSDATETGPKNICCLRVQAG